MQMASAVVRHLTFDHEKSNLAAAMVARQQQVCVITNNHLKGANRVGTSHQSEAQMVREAQTGGRR